MITMRPNGYSVSGVADYLRGIANSGDSLLMVEIGSYAGESMAQFAASRLFGRIVCIDPWVGGWCDRDPASRTNMAEVERAFDNRADRVRGEGIGVMKHKGTIDTFIASDAFAKVAGKVDFVYIDACHEYEPCKHDIALAVEYLKPCLAIGGHDYHPFWSGVMMAVNERFGKPSAVFPDQSWIVRL